MLKQAQMTKRPVSDLKVSGFFVYNGQRLFIRRKVCRASNDKIDKVKYMALKLSTTCFWDVDVRELNKEKDKFFIISRVLEYGMMRDVVNLLSEYDSEEIAEVVKRSRIIGLATANFWSLILNIPRSEITRCLEQANFHHGR